MIFTALKKITCSNLYRKSTLVKLEVDSMIFTALKKPPIAIYTFLHIVLIISTILMKISF
jgi:hypothetical protein